MTPESKY